MSPEPIPALRALSRRALSDLARGLRFGHIAADASSFMIRHMVPGVSEDAARKDALLRRFAERFMRQEWPGPRMPELFYDPRSLAGGDGPRASLHAKCVVVDGAKAFIGSANLTEAAQLRNIEIGIVTADSAIAAAIERHINALIEAGHLQPLPL